MTEFNLETRYTVFKLSDIEKLPEDVRQYAILRLQIVAELLESHGIAERHVLVLEQDWPEYQLALKALEERVSAEVHE